MENQEKNETTVLPENPGIMVKNPRIGRYGNWKRKSGARTSWSSSEPNGSARSRNISSR